MGALFSRFFIPSDSGGPERGRLWLLRVSTPVPPSFAQFGPRRRALSARQRKPCDAPHHATKPSPRQMTLGQQQPVIAGTGPNLLPVSVFPTLVSAPARLSRNRPSVPSVHAGAAHHQPPGVNYQTLIFCGWRDPGHRPRPRGPGAQCRKVPGSLARPGGNAGAWGGPERPGSAPRGRSQNS
jgi:hypothetical protein